MDSPLCTGVGSRSHRASLTAALALLAAGVLCSYSSHTAQAASVLSFESFSAGAINMDGSPSTQAGAYPFELTTSFELGTVFDARTSTDVPAAAVKDTVVEIPAGVVGDPTAVPQCRERELYPATESCPTNTQVGYADVDLSFFGRSIQRSAVYNVVPAAGEPAALRFNIASSVIHIGVRLRSDGDYGVTAVAKNASAGAPVYGVLLHLWGVPADPSHDADRRGPAGPAPGPSGLPLKPFLRNSTSCVGPTATTIRLTSWEEPDAVVTATSSAPALTGCDQLAFSPMLSLAPDTRQANAPAGLGINLDLPQSDNPSGLATADLKRVVVQLPAGVALNPGAGEGLDVCSDGEFGLRSGEPDNCPNASHIGSVKVVTPLLSKPLEGSIYLAAPHEQSPAAAAAGQMFRLFIEAHGSGVEVKLAGSVVPDPVTGQLVATFDNNPQLPFSSFHMDFVGGSRAPLSLPKACGTYTTHAELTSWASEAPVSSDSSFTVDQNCGQDARFEPSLEAGVTNSVAGAFSPFTMTLTRPDGQQDVSSLDLVLPPGLVGRLAGVPLCPDAQAAAGFCDSASQVGRVTVAAGAGATPLWVPQAGRTPTAVFLAGPYEGAPFSLSVVVPAQAGPFDLGTVVVRAPLFIDPVDAHVSVKSDPIPTIIDGVPLNVQKLNVTVDRPGFMVSPTNCGQMRISGTARSSAGTTASLASPFQVGSCASLRFAPKFSVSTAGSSTKANGASLTTKLSFPAGSLGTQANIARVKVELPRQLPSRLATLNKACTSAQFDANPAGCPVASIVGHATVHTPLLPVPLVGPAYFVSHGGEAFPSLVMVLQGYGVTIELTGSTLIRAGVTSTTFKTVPDVPFSSFELTLPQGKFSALAANLPAKAKRSFCGQKLVMPSEFIAQNGATIRRRATVSVTGCTKKTTSARGAKHGFRSSRRR